jgi:hypothetical protein
MGVLTFMGYDGTNYVEGANVTAGVMTGASVGTGNVPSYLSLNTTPASATVPLAGLFIDSSQRVGLGGNTAPAYTLDVSGTINATSFNGVALSDATNLAFGTSTGTKLGTATSQKLSLWNATPIVQPTTGIAAATFVTNTSGTLNDSATWDGYTIGQVVKALRNIGILA